MIPLNNIGKFELEFDHAAIINVSYTGGYAIDTYEVSASPAASRLKIHGGLIYGNSTSPGFVRIFPTNDAALFDMGIFNFTAGDGIRNEGGILTRIYHNYIQGNAIGIHALGTRCLTSSPYTCGSGISAGYAAYQANGLRIENNIVANNEDGYFEDSGSYALMAWNTVIQGNDFEANTGVAISLIDSAGDQLLDNYFESTPHFVEVGQTDIAALGVVSRGNHFTSSASTPYIHELINAQHTVIADNYEGSSGSSCFGNVAGESYTVLGSNVIASTNQWCNGGVAGIPSQSVAIYVSPINYFFAPAFSLTAGDGIIYSAGTQTLGIKGGTSGGECQPVDLG